MYRHILAAVNEHSNSEWAARYALALARVCQAQLTLIFAATPATGREVVHRAEATLERLFLEATSQGVAVESVVRAGDPFQVIKELVAEREIQLTMAATRREDLSRRFFLKTLARDLMLRLPCSVALVRVVHFGRVHPRRLLVPFRGHISKMEERVYFVARLAEAFEAQVTLFHAPPSLTGYFRGRLTPAPKELEPHIPGDIAKFSEMLERCQIAHEKRLGRGAVATAITMEAAAQRSDLIIMGASGRGLMESMLWGNPVEEVLRETPCNLIILLPRLKVP
jgi:nucleotide-binding universal stress UspA family protein